MITFLLTIKLIANLLAETVWKYQCNSKEQIFNLHELMLCPAFYNNQIMISTFWVLHKDSLGKVIFIIFSIFLVIQLHHFLFYFPPKKSSPTGKPKCKLNTENRVEYWQQTCQNVLWKDHETQLHKELLMLQSGESFP